MKTQILTICCLAALLSGIAANTVSNNETECPQMCPAIYKPVCASDGFNLKEFASACNMMASNCRRERNAQTVYAQKDMAWCSSQEVTDLHNVLNIKLDIEGCLKPCPMIYQPVCVTNGKVRGLVPNACSLDNFNCALMSKNVEPTDLLRVLQEETCKV